MGGTLLKIQEQHHSTSSASQFTRTWPWLPKLRQGLKWRRNLSTRKWLSIPPHNRLPAVGLAPVVHLHQLLVKLAFCLQLLIHLHPRVPHCQKRHTQQQPPPFEPVRYAQLFNANVDCGVLSLYLHRREALDQSTLSAQKGRPIDQSIPSAQKGRP
jgi:hypothetical protein